MTGIERTDLTPRKPPGARPRGDDRERFKLAAVELYKKLGSIRKVRIEMGCSHGYVQRLLTEAEDEGLVTVNPPGAYVRSADDKAG